MIQVCSNTLYATQRWNWGKVKVKVKRESLAGDRACGVVCEGEPVIRLESSECVGTHYCLAVGNDEGLELDETDEDEELSEGDEE